MKKAKIEQQKGIKQRVIKYANEDTNEIKKFALILIGVAVIAVLLYFVTAKYLVKDNFQKEEEKTTAEEITDTTVKGGTLFNRTYSEYYVLAYDKSSDTAPYYSVLTNLYKGSTKIYTMDLSLEVNKQYTGEKGNSKATKPSELSIVNPTLIHIKNGKIDKYIEGKDEITKTLS